MNQAPGESSSENIRTSGPTGDRGVGAFFTGLVLMPGDFNRRRRGATPPARSEVIMVTAVTLACVVLGGAVGGWAFGHAAGAMLGVVGGLIVSVIPLTVGLAILGLIQRARRSGKSD